MLSKSEQSIVRHNERCVRRVKHVSKQFRHAWVNTNAKYLCLGPAECGFSPVYSWVPRIVLSAIFWAGLLLIMKYKHYSSDKFSQCTGWLTANLKDLFVDAPVYSSSTKIVLCNLNFKYWNTHRRNWFFPTNVNPNSRHNLLCHLCL